MTREFTASLGKQLGRKGAVQVTYVWRNTSNFIDDVIDIENGTTNVVRDGVDIGTFTNIIYTNTNAPERRYQGVILQASYRPKPQWTFGANWTIQIENDGTFEGEATNQPGVPSIFNDYPGIYDPARHTPDGHLSGYQRDKVRIWTIYTWDMHRAGMLSWSGLVRYESPRHYSLVATGVPITSIQQGILDSLGYPDAPSSQSIYFGGRGSEAFHSVTLVDSSLNYDIPVFKRARPFVKFDVFNVFNQNDPVTFNTTVLVDPTSPKDALGLPTGFIRGSNFGKTTSNGNYPAGRTLLMALGFRF